MASGFLNQSGIPAIAVSSDELLHYRFPLINSQSLLICISQSGESYEITGILKKLPENVTCIGICNEENSSLSRHPGITLLSKAGKEEMTSTKTFVCTNLVAIIFALAITGQWNHARITEIESAIRTVRSLIQNQDLYLPAVMDLIRNTSYIQIIGRGLSIASAQQGALMFMEGARLPASALSGGEFRHGPLEMVKEGFVVLIIAPAGITYIQSMILARDIVRFGGRVILFSNRDIEPPDDNILFVKVPCPAEYLFSIASVIPMQLIVNQLATEKGQTPGDFIRGTKITLIE
jgi:glucosamine--fructose-6-phosphate aminotransferase (isomerizing)